VYRATLRANALNDRPRRNAQLPRSGFVQHADGAARLRRPLIAQAFGGQGMSMCDALRIPNRFESLQQQFPGGYRPLILFASTTSLHHVTRSTSETEASAELFPVSILES
jgi:hypothetical protein